MTSWVGRPQAAQSEAAGEGIESVSSSLSVWSVLRPTLAEENEGDTGGVGIASVIAGGSLAAEMVSKRSSSEVSGGSVAVSESSVVVVVKGVSVATSEMYGAKVKSK